MVRTFLAILWFASICYVLGFFAYELHSIENNIKQERKNNAIR